MNEINFEIQDIEKIDLSMDVGIKEIYPPIENLEVTPTKQEQVFNHENSYGYDKVIIEPIPDEYIIPDGTLEVGTNGDVDVTAFKTARVGVYVPPTLQDKEVTPTKEIQTITSDENYDGLNQVKVNAIPNEYTIPTGTLEITENGEHNVKDYEEAIVNVESSGGVQQPFVIDCATEEGSGTTITLRNYDIRGTNRPAVNKHNVTIGIFWVRSDYTLPSNMTLLAETEFFSGADTRQKLIIGLYDINSTQDATITQATSGRIAKGYIRLSNCDIPEVILNETGISSNLTINTDNELYIYVFSQILSSTVNGKDFSSIYGNGQRTKIFFSHLEGEKKITVDEDNYYGIIGLKCKFKQLQ